VGAHRWGVWGLLGSGVATLALFGADDLTLPESLQEAVEHGEVFTRGWVVELILDLVGYAADRDLAGFTLVEPACGQGAFLGVIARRLTQSCRDRGRPLTDAVDAVRAFDLLQGNVDCARDLVTKELLDNGWDS